MTDIKNVFVVYDPTQEPQPALERAALIAGETEINLHVYGCVYTEISPQGDKQVEIDKFLARQQVILNSALAPLRARGIDLTSELEWGKDWYRGVVSAAERHNASLLLKSSYQHTAGERIFNRSSDWTLIRECKCPVLLVKDSEPREVRRVLAAVDIRNEKDSYTQLNDNIISFSKQLLDDHEAEVHFLNVHTDLASVPDRSALVRNCGVGSDRVHIRMGEPGQVIVDNAKELDVSMVVIGNSSRSGLSAVVKGNTIEKILDKLECDVLSIP